MAIWYRRSTIAVLLSLLALLGGCSSVTNPSAPAPGGSTPPGSVATGPGAGTTLAPPRFDPAAVGVATVEGPIVGGKGAPVLGPPGFDLSTVGYAQSEYFLSGRASSYTSDTPLSADGLWNVRTDGQAPYTTRIVVRRPADAARFNGTVYVEWLNVSGGLDASPDWTFAHVALIRAGAAWVGVSAQVVGIEGGAGPGAILALKTADPERYAPLAHPGDDYSYDMFSQAGAALRTQAAKTLGGLTPARVLAIGESQSAFRLSTYVDAVAPTAKVFDAYLLHSRGAGGTPLNMGTRVATRGSDQPAAKVGTPSPLLVRTDLAAPVMVLSSESDLIGTGLGYAQARQPDTRTFRGWEVAGTAHVDAYGLGIGDDDDGRGGGDTKLFDAMSAPPSKVYFGVITCDAPINTGPHTYVARAALVALDEWVRTGEPPPEMPRLELDEAGTAYLLDGAGNVRGGIRTPQVDVPIAKLSGLGQTGASFCGLFGTTVPFEPAARAAAYPDHATFVERWGTATDAAVKAGALLPADADRLRTVAAASTIGG